MLLFILGECSTKQQLLRFQMRCNWRCKTKKKNSRLFWLPWLLSLILHLVNSYFMHVCFLLHTQCECVRTVRVFYLVVYLFCFLVALCSQFAYRSADLLIILESIHTHTQTYAFACMQMQHTCIQERKTNTILAIRRPKRCSFSEFGKQITKTKRTKKNQMRICSPYLSTQCVPFWDAVYSLAVCALRLVNRCICFLCLLLLFSSLLTDNKLKTPFSDSRLIAFMHYLCTFVIWTTPRRIRSILYNKYSFPKIMERMASFETAAVHPQIVHKRISLQEKQFNYYYFPFTCAQNEN